MPKIQEVVIFDPDNQQETETDDLKVFNIEIARAKKHMHKHSRSVIETMKRKGELDMMPPAADKATLPTFEPVKLNQHKFSFRPSPARMRPMATQRKQKSVEYVSERKRQMIAMIMENQKEY